MSRAECDAASPAPTAHAAPPTTPRRVESRDPRRVVWRTWPTTGADDVRQAINVAQAAQLSWAAAGLAHRRAVLDHFRRCLLARRDEVSGTIAREVGKPAGEALGTEVLVTLEHARWLVTHGSRLLQPARHGAGSVAFLRKRLSVERVPLGVLAVLSPWNFPFMLAASPVLAGLLAGNAILLKPSEFATASAQCLVDLLHDAGVPRDVIQCLPGDASTGEALVTGGVEKVFFTGSTAGGRAVARAAARQMTPVSLELGGADAALVLEDADPLLTARGLLWGRFTNAGQSCTAPKRVYAVEAVHDALLAAIRRELPAWVRGTGAEADVGPLIRPAQTTLLEAQMQDAVQRGATVVASAPSELGGSGGDALPPAAVLGGVAPGMRVVEEETFGPLLAVMRVPSEAAAIAEANRSEYGLSASVWTRSPARARRVAAQLAVGTVMINDVVVNAGIAGVAHGGVRASGSGRSHGAEGLLECTTTRTVVEDRLPMVPQLWWRLASAAQAPVYDAAAVLLHGDGLGARLRALGHLVRGLRWRSAASSDS